jgi:hypothetical protein
VVFRRCQPSEPEAIDVLFDSTNVDLVSLSPDGTTILLHIVNDSPWSGSDAQIESLQLKVQTYVSFALDGSMVSSYPETAGLAWQIRLDDQVGKRDERSMRVLDQLSAAVRGYGGYLFVADAYLQLGATWLEPPERA